MSRKLKLLLALVMIIISAIAIMRYVVVPLGTKKGWFKKITWLSSLLAKTATPEQLEAIDRFSEGANRVKPTASPEYKAHRLAMAAKRK